jgi:hypothetical protein
MYIKYTSHNGQCPVCYSRNNKLLPQRLRQSAYKCIFCISVVALSFWLFNSDFSTRLDIQHQITGLQINYKGYGRKETWPILM